VSYKKIGITGANGHVGATLARLLIAEGFLIRALIHEKSNALSTLPLEIVQGDLFDIHSLDDFCRGLDAVVHSAGLIGIESKEAKKTLKINVEGTRNVVNACLKAKVKKMVQVSSIQAFKDRRGVLMDENATKADETGDPYSYSKSLGEIEVRNAMEQGLQVSIVNPTAIIGPNDFNPGAQSQAILKIVHRSVPALIKASFDWVDVRDVAKGILGALLYGENGNNYILSGHWRSFKEIANAIALWSGNKPISIYLPLGVAAFGAEFLEIWAKLLGKTPLLSREAMQYVRNTPKEISHQKAEECFAFKARPFSETLADTLLWMQGQNWI